VYVTPHHDFKGTIFYTESLESFLWPMKDLLKSSCDPKILENFEIVDDINVISRKIEELL
jgi:hypothetical protein